MPIKGMDLVSDANGKGRCLSKVVNEVEVGRSLASVIVLSSICT